VRFELIIVLIFVGLFVYSFKKAQKRRGDLQNLAKRMGFSYIMDRDSIKKLLEGLKLYTKAGSMFNILQKEQNNILWTLFEYKWRMQQSDRRSIYYFVALAQVPNKNFTEFHLSPESILDFGGKDIDFVDRPTFSKRYFLKGPDEDALRKIFTPSIISFFERETEKIYIECKGDRFIYYSQKAPKPEEYPKFLTKAEQTLSLFL